MKELLRIKRETPETAAELINSLAVSPHDAGIRIIADGRDVVINTESELVGLLMGAIHGICAVCHRTGQLLLQHTTTTGSTSPAKNEAPASNGDNNPPSVDKAA